MIYDYDSSKTHLWSKLFVLDLIEDVSDQETRLTAAEENIQGKIALHKKWLLNWQHIISVIELYFSGLQMTDVELDARVTALEEDGGNANGNGKNNMINLKFAQW